MTTALERDLEACEAWNTGALRPHECRARAARRWPAALRVVQAVMEMYGVHHLTKDVRDALRAFEEEG